MSLIDFKGNEIRDWSQIPSDELWGFMIRYSRGDKHSTEMEFRKVMKHRNVSQFKTEKMLDAYLGTGDSIDFQPQSLLDIYEQGCDFRLFVGRANPFAVCRPVQSLDVNLCESQE